MQLDSSTARRDADHLWAAAARHWARLDRGWQATLLGFGIVLAQVTLQAV